MIKTKLFQHRLWMTPVASYVGLLAMLVAGWALVTGAASPLWLLTTLVGTAMLLASVTVGMHRLFCHQSFCTTPTWHVLLAVWGTLALYGSTVQWPAMHRSHHRWSDSPRDPHYTGWRYLFWKSNNPTEFDPRTLVRLYRQPLHRNLHKYYVLVIAATVWIFWAVSPWALIFGYLAPLGWLHLVGSLHQVYAHGRRGARDLGWLEFVAWTGGEWHHRPHHRRPRARRFGKYDAGYWLIRCIQTPCTTKN
jgi:fatty-acid desaturase